MIGGPVRAALVLAAGAALCLMVAPRSFADGTARGTPQEVTNLEIESDEFAEGISLDGEVAVETISGVRIVSVTLPSDGNEACVVSPRDPGTPESKIELHLERGACPPGHARSFSPIMKFEGRLPRCSGLHVAADAGGGLFISYPDDGCSYVAAVGGCSDDKFVVSSPGATLRQGDRKRLLGAKPFSTGARGEARVQLLGKSTLTLSWKPAAARVTVLRELPVTRLRFTSDTPVPRDAGASSRWDETGPGLTIDSLALADGKLLLAWHKDAPPAVATTASKTTVTERASNWTIARIWEAVNEKVKALLLAGMGLIGTFILRRIVRKPQKPSAAAPPEKPEGSP